MRISNYPTDTLTGGELILATDVNTSTQEYKTVNFSVDTLKTFLAGTDDTNEFTNITLGGSLKFEGATADAYETTLGVVDPTADRVINLPNVAGTLPVLAVASTTAITSTPEELNVLDGYTGSVTELNYLDTLHATGVTDTEFDYLDITTLGLVEASKVATASSNGDIKFPDNKKIQLGADGDFEISHTGTDTLFKNVKENGTTIFQVNDGGTTRSAIQAGGAGGYVKLYGAGVKRLETTADGITIGWPLVCSDDVTLSSTTPQLHLTNTGTAASNWVSFNTSAGRQGFVGQGHTGQQIGLYADNAEVIISSYGTAALTLGTSQAATFASSVKATQFKLSSLNTAPSSASDTGTLGEVRIDASYIYVCTASNTWKRAQIATW